LATAVAATACLTVSCQVTDEPTAKGEDMTPASPPVPALAGLCGVDPAERLLVDFGATPVPVTPLGAEAAVVDGALAVTFPAAGAGASLTPGDGVWDVSAHVAVAVALENSGPGPVTLTGTLNNRWMTNGFLHLPAGQSGTMLILLPRKKDDLTDRRKDQFTGMNGVPGGHIAHWAGPDARRIRSLVLRDLDGVSVGATVRVTTIHARGRYGSLAAETEATFFPFVDQFGQFKHRDWPGKTRTPEDLTAARAREAADLAAHPGPAKRSRYGGWLEGPKLDATGHFRTQKLNGKWWLVDPEGYLFWSHGITGVHTRGGTTKATGREHCFEAIPEAFLDKKGLSLGTANLHAKYGADWSAQTADVAHRRLRSWGMNTIANWSDMAVCRQGRTPYVVAVHYGWGEDAESAWKDPAILRRVLKRRLQSERGTTGEDPWCIGYFVDNELRWNEVMPPNEYFRIVREAVKDAAPNKLYLGSRLHGQMQPFGGPRHAAAAAAKHCDVLGINRYRFSPADLRAIKGADVPIIIGEFHFGALDRGMLHTGLRAVPNQEQRAHAYTHFLTQALKHPNIVGTHWFQYREQAVTGRADGENYQIGFVDICDTPYPETIQAARAIGRRMYELRYE
jgi:hypothetical protein